MNAVRNAVPPSCMPAAIFVRLWILSAEATASAPSRGVRRNWSM